MLPVLVTLALIQAGPIPSEPAGTNNPAPALFSFACVFGLQPGESPDSYIAGSAEQGRMIKEQFSELGGVIALDNAEGNGCRVQDTGADAATRWAQAFVLFGSASASEQKSCSLFKRSEGHLEAICPWNGTKLGPRGEGWKLSLDEVHSPAEGVVAAFTYVKR